NLPATVAIIAVVYNLLFAITCSYIPDDPIYLGQIASVYGWAGCALSLLGFVGIVTKQAKLVVLLAHCILVDTCVTAFCRFFALLLFVDAFSEDSVCGGAYASPWRDEDRLSHNVTTGAIWQNHALRPTFQVRGCHIALGGVRMMLVVLLMTLAVVQGMLAIAMRRHGKEIKTAKEETKGPASSNQLGMERISEKA
ncbi:hypothetical protein LTR36_008096, partial [Oleoguttula mirabilis]